jgi:hypothetical protein
MLVQMMRLHFVLDHVVGNLELRNKIIVILVGTNDYKQIKIKVPFL